MGGLPPEQRGGSLDAVRPSAQGVGVKFDAVKWGWALLLMLSLMAGSAKAAWVWQDNAYGKQLTK